MLNLPKLPSNIEKGSEKAAIKLQKLLAVFNSGGDKNKKELAAWGINRQYYMRSMFYMYLFNKYGNSCIIDENPSCKTLPDICETVGDMVLKVYGFEFKNNTTQDRTKWRAYQKYLERYAKKVHKCLKHKNIVIIPVRMHFPGTGSFQNYARGGSHANLLVVRKEHQTIEVVEPHGSHLGTNNSRMNPYKAYSNIVDIINNTLPKKAKKYNMVFSDEVCPRISGIQSLEGYANLFKDDNLEGGGYCSLWSMFTTEMILANPKLTTRQVMEILLDILYGNNNGKTDYYTKVNIGNYLLLVARGYATFITRKVEEYFADIYGLRAGRAIELGGTANYQEISQMRRFFGPFLKIQSELSLNPKMTLKKLMDKVNKGKVKNSTDLEAYREVLERLIKKDIRYSIGTTRSTGLAIDLKYKKRCPHHLVRNPKTGRCIKPRNKTQKNTLANKTTYQNKKTCPPGKELNPKTNRCRKIKTKKNTVVRIISNPKTITPQKITQPKILKKHKVKTHARKRCPNGTRRNPKTKACDPKNKQKKVLKIVKKFTKKNPHTVIVVKKIQKKTRKRCPNGSRKDKKTGKCIVKN